MGNCKYCEKSAGIFSYKHKECEKLFYEGVSLLSEYTFAYLKSDQPIEIFRERIQQLTQNYFIDEDTLYRNIIKTWGFAIKEILNYHKANELQIQKVISFQNVFINENIKKIKELYPAVEVVEGGKIRYNAKSYEVLKITDSLVLCKTTTGSFTVLKKYQLENYPILDQLTEGAIDLIQEYKKNIIESFLLDKIFAKESPKIIEDQLNIYKDQFMIDNEVVKIKLIDSLIQYIFHLRDNIELNEIDEEYIINLMKKFEIKENDLNQNAVYTEFIQLLILQDIQNNKFPSRVKISNDIPFNLQKREKLIWLSNDVSLYEEQISRHYEGGHIGMSFRVSEGVYLRGGRFKGKPIQTSATKKISEGIVGYTNVHLYFFSYEKSFKIRYDKIISVIPRADGVIIIKDAASSKPIILKNENGLFVYNLITSLTQNSLVPKNVDSNISL